MKRFWKNTRIFFNDAGQFRVCQLLEEKKSQESEFANSEENKSQEQSETFLEHKIYVLEHKIYVLEHKIYVLEQVIFFLLGRTDTTTTTT